MRFRRKGFFPILVLGFAFLIAQAALGAQFVVTLSSSAAPNAGQAGLTNISVTGSNFPSGTILPANVTATLTPSTAGPPTATTAATAVITILGSTRRVTFQIPGSIVVSSPTAYQVSIAGSDPSGNTFTSGNTAVLTVNPPAQIVSVNPNSGQVATTLSVTITGLYTTFVQGATQASFGPGISVGGGTTGGFGPVTVSSLTNATAQLTIDPSAALGTRTVLAQTGVQQASLSVGFTVNPPIRNVTAYGATGNGMMDDTTAINDAIGALLPGDTLLFPCGTYRTTSQLTINVSNVTVDGSGCATIHNDSPGSTGIMVIGKTGNANPDYGPAVALSATAHELATSFTTVSSLGVSAGDYVYIHQGGLDYSEDTLPGHPTNCDVSGCRGEVLKVESVDGNTITVTTALHDSYDPSVNAAVVQKIFNPVTGVTVRNITFEGNQALVYGLGMSGVAESRVQGVTARNVQGAALFSVGSFNLSYSSITVTQAGSTTCGDAFALFGSGNMTVNGVSISNENPGTGSGCLGDGAFGLGLGAVANSTFTNVAVDATGAYGRPFKATAARWNTFNSLTVKNGGATNNGITLQYYSSHNTFNNCVVTNNGVGTGTGTGNAGINTFGNFNQYNAFNNCTVTGNGNTQFFVSSSDALRLGQDSYITINGGTFTGTNNVEAVIVILGSNASVTSANINAPGLKGLYLGSTNACVNNNTLTGTFNFAGILVSDPVTDVGTGNILNGNSSNLGAGLCYPRLSTSSP